MKTQIGFKIVSTDERKLLSCVVTGSAIVQYRVGKYVEPHPGHGPLAVFNTKANAENFIGDLPYTAIYECRYEPSDELLMYMPDGHTMGPWPVGSALARKVKLIRRVR